MVVLVGFKGFSPNWGTFLGWKPPWDTLFRSLFVFFFLFRSSFVNFVFDGRWNGSFHRQVNRPTPFWPPSFWDPKHPKEGLFASKTCFKRVPGWHKSTGARRIKDLRASEKLVKPPAQSQRLGEIIEETKWIYHDLGKIRWVKTCF